MEDESENEKNVYLDKLKTVNLKSGTKEYPTINLMLNNTKDKKKFEVTNKFIFGDSIGSRNPFFVYNIKLEIIFTYFEKLISEIPDEILLENIKLLNKILKGKSPQIDDLSKIKGFKYYAAASFNIIKNSMYEVYKELLKKLFLFSKSLFEAIFE